MKVLRKQSLIYALSFHYIFYVSINVKRDFYLLNCYPSVNVGTVNYGIMNKAMSQTKYFISFTVPLALFFSLSI